MRTQDEILQRFKDVEKDDFFGTQRSDLIDFMTYENAKPYLKDGVTAEQFATNPAKTPKECMIDYMEFAWEKANKERGLSAMRSLEHYMTWLWLDGDNEIWPTLNNYNYYGKPHLITICEYLGLDASQWDDGIRSNG